ncbi:MAG TPA: hypothetical protein VJB57_19845 [Dehalococcoidia bacterium]|nr:hypothetical protein [Dehalococcoidia bacterium]
MTNVALGEVVVGLFGLPGSVDGSGGPVEATPSLGLDETLARAGFGVLTPRHLPVDCTFLDGTVINSPRQAAILTYVGRDGGVMFTIFQAPTDQYRSADGAPSYFVVGDDLKEAVLDSIPAASSQRIAGGGVVNSLVYERDGILVHIVGRAISQGELESVASSI